MGNDPMNGTDPTGMFCDGKICTAIKTTIRNALPGPDNAAELKAKYGQPISNVSQRMPYGQTIAGGEIQVLQGLTANLGGVGRSPVGKISSAGFRADVKVAQNATTQAKMAGQMALGEMKATSAASQTLNSTSVGGGLGIGPQ